MDTQDLVSRLQFFYGLELSQVRMYTLQSEAVTDPYLKQVFRHLASIEQSHVQRIKKEIEKLGEARLRPVKSSAPLLAVFWESSQGQFLWTSCCA